MQLSAAEAAAYIPDKKALYEALVRNQYILPPKNDPICSRKFLLGVKSKHFWMLRADEVVALKVCADPPTRRDLAQMLVEVLESMPPLNDHRDQGMRNTAEYIRRVTPTAKWMITVLSNLKANHQIFDKDYVRPVLRPQMQQFAPMVDNEDHFFDGLPIATPMSKRRISLLAPEMKQQLKVSKL